MQFLKLAAVMAIAALVGGCEGQSQTERAIAGGLAGGLLGVATENNVGTTAAIGALAGMASCGVPGAPRCR